jgi:hypothetical protein
LAINPRDIWAFSMAMVGKGLGLKKANFKIRSFVVVGLLVLMLLSLPAYLVLDPISTFESMVLIFWYHSIASAWLRDDPAEWPYNGVPVQVYLGSSG